MRRPALEMPSPRPTSPPTSTQAKAQIAAANRAIGKPLDPQVIEERAPFELAPDPERCPRAADGRQPRAALLIHGLGEHALRDARSGRALRRRLLSACARSCCPATARCRATCSTSATPHWVEATRAGAQSFAGLAERLYLVGFASRRHARAGLCARRAAADRTRARRPRAAGAGASRRAPATAGSRARPPRPGRADARGRLRPAPARRGSGPLRLARAQCRTPAGRAGRAAGRARAAARAAGVHGAERRGRGGRCRRRRGAGSAAS